MKTTHITGTNLYPSSLCLGSAEMGATIDQEQSYTILDAFTNSGGTFIDTAKIYNDWIPGETSRSEKTIGSWLASRKKRSQVILATKGAHFDLAAPQQSRLSPQDIQFDLEASLKHLQTNWIDLYWLHRDDPHRPVEEIIQTLEAQVRAGKIRYYGFSNWRLDRLIDAVEYAQNSGCLGFSAVQNMWSLAKINTDAVMDTTIVVMDEALWEFHNSHQIAAIPFTSQAGGLFQKMASGKTNVLSELQRKTYLNPITEQRFKRIIELHELTGLTISQIVLGYLTSQPFPVIPIFGARSLGQLDEALTSGDITLTEAQVNFLLS